jgi:DnaJ-class molecular chaperone
MRDFYEVLGVVRTADQDNIRRAYRRLARQYHPDLNPAAADHFKEITGAYDVLGDVPKRALYDEFGEVCLKPGFDPVVARYSGLGTGARNGAGGGSGGGSPFAEFFENLSGSGTASGTRPYQGSSREPEHSGAPDAEIPGFGDLGSTSGTSPYRGSPGDRYDPNSSTGTASGTTPYQGSAGERYDPSSFAASASGTTPYRGSATEAGRTGFKPHTSKQEAYFPGKTYGDGARARAPDRQSDPYSARMRSARDTAPPPPAQQPTPGRPSSSSPTARPHASQMGRGAQSPSYSTTNATPVPGTDISVSVELSLMESLRGTTREMSIERTLHTGRREREGLRVSIKPGVEDGEQIRLGGKGNQGRRGGPAGDLLLTIQVSAHRHFRREGHDLYLEVPVTLREALVGSKIEVPTPDGMIRVQVPSGSTNGRRLRLRRRGVSVGNGQRGDLYLILRPTPPAADTPEVRRLLEQLERFYPAGGVRAELEL